MKFWTEAHKIVMYSKKCYEESCNGVHIWQIMFWKLLGIFSKFYLQTEFFYFIPFQITQSVMNKLYFISKIIILVTWEVKKLVKHVPVYFETLCTMLKLLTRTTSLPGNNLPGLLCWIYLYYFCWVLLILFLPSSASTQLNSKAEVSLILKFSDQ